MFPESRIAKFVSEFKRNWPAQLSLERLNRLCIEQGVKWRDRVLPPAVTIQLFLLQILNGNTACSHLRHLSGLKFSSMSYCKARMRIPLRVMEALVGALGREMLGEESGSNLWRGHRVWLGDGTGCSMPDTAELRKRFGQPGSQRKSCGFPVAHLLMLVNAGTGMLQKMLVSPLRVHDISRAAELHPEMREGDIVVVDRGFCSFAYLALLAQLGINIVVRIGESLKVDFRQARRNIKISYKVIRGERIKKLGKMDQLILWCKPKRLPPWMSEEQFNSLPATMVVRELRYQLDKRGFRSSIITVVTTLVDSKVYPKAAIAELFGLRWEIETDFRHLKITMGMDVLRCKTVDGVLKELLAFYIVYNLIRLVMLEAAKSTRAAPNRVSFIDALRWLISENTNELLENLIVNPQRPGRLNPRIVKRRPKAYPRMTKPRRSFPGFISTDQLLAA